MNDEFLYAVEREYPYPIEQLWAAWTKAAALEQWYSPTDLSVVPGSVVSDAVVGGWWTVAVDVTVYGFTAYFYGRYTVVDPLSRLEHRLAYTQSAEEFAARDESMPSHRIVIDFEERGHLTWVRFSQFGELPEGEAAQAQQGMESYFDSLGEYLNG
jgi:uncharacterized protein YndB with AHSA1/START domain